MSACLRFVLDPVSSPEVLELLATHLETMRSQSPACSVHALDVSGLQGEGVSFWSAWLGKQLVGCGALKRLTGSHGELKSMHVLQAHRGRGYARQLLTFIESEAQRAGYTRLSLETGASNDFAGARRLYSSCQYQLCEPFADYVVDPLSCYMTRELTLSPAGAPE